LPAATVGAASLDPGGHRGRVRPCGAAVSRRRARAGGARAGVRGRPGSAV